MTTYPWKTLTEDAILNTVELHTGLQLTNLCLKRNSYINRVFEIEDVEKHRYIVKFYRPGRWTSAMILDEHRLLADLVSHDIPVIPPILFSSETLFFLGEIPFAVFPKKGGRVLDELNRSRWEEVGRLLGRVHGVTSSQKKSARLRWTPDMATQKHLKILHTTHSIPLESQSAFDRVVTQFISKSSPLFQKEPCFLLHGDCHLGNIIFRPDEGLYIVDFDDMVVGSPIQDVWMLLPDDPDYCRSEIEWFKDGYDTFYDSGNLNFELIPVLRGMRQIHFAAWCALQQQDPSFRDSFPDWGSATYWNQLMRDLLDII